MTFLPFLAIGRERRKDGANKPTRLIPSILLTPFVIVERNTQAVLLGMCVKHMNSDMHVVILLSDESGPAAMQHGNSATSHQLSAAAATLLMILLVLLAF